jgi:hypothetical protein
MKHQEINRIEKLLTMYAALGMYGGDETKKLRQELLKLKFA